MVVELEGGANISAINFQNLDCCPPDAAISYQWPSEQLFLFASIEEGDSYIWDFGDGTFSTERFPTHQYAATSTFNVCLTVTNACGTDIHCETLDINALSTSTLHDVASALSIFPNPTSNGFHIRLERGMLQSVRLTDALGRTVKEIAASGNASFIGTDGLSAGLYIATVVTQDGSVARRVVVE
jgi:PKD repeat protein